MPTTPTTEISDPNKQNPTPIKARIQGTVDFLESQGIKHKKEEVFQFNGVSHATGYRLLKSDNLRTPKIAVNMEETRGRKFIITPDQIREMDQILQTTGHEGRALTWKQLGLEANVEAFYKTIKNTMGSLQYHKCIACQRGWQSPASKKNRVEYLLN